MILKIFAVFDSKAASYLLPFYASNLPVGQRHFARGVADRSMDIGQFPEDFSLWELGTFDTNTAVIVPLPQPINHGLGILYRQGENQNASATIGNETHVQPSAQGRNTAEHVRQVTRS